MGVHLGGASKIKHYNKRYGRLFRQCETIFHLGLRQPVELRYRNLRHVRNYCVRAANGHEGSLGKEQCEVSPKMEVSDKNVEARQRQKPEKERARSHLHSRL